MKQSILFLYCLTIAVIQLNAQCKLAIDEVDPFDSTRLVVAEPVPVGYKIPSNFLLSDGTYSIIDEGNAVFSWTEGDRDSIISFFFSFGIFERGYLSAEQGNSVLLAMSNKDVIGLYNVPDRGEFDKNTNMRVYTHTCYVPIDKFFVLAEHKIEAIRFRYKDKKNTVVLDQRQQDALLKAIRCVGEAVGYYPIRP